MARDRSLAVSDSGAHSRCDSLIKYDLHVSNNCDNLVIFQHNSPLSKFSHTQTNTHAHMCNIYLHAVLTCTIRTHIYTQTCTVCIQTNSTALSPTTHMLDMHTQYTQTYAVCTQLTHATHTHLHNNYVHTHTGL